MIASKPTSTDVVNAIAIVARLRIDQMYRLNPRYRRFKRDILRQIARKLKMPYTYMGDRNTCQSDYTYASGKRDWLAYQQQTKAQKEKPSC